MGKKKLRTLTWKHRNSDHLDFLEKQIEPGTKGLTILNIGPGAMSSNFQTHFYPNKPKEDIKGFNRILRFIARLIDNTRRKKGWYSSLEVFEIEEIVQKFSKFKPTIIVVDLEEEVLKHISDELGVVKVHKDIFREKLDVKADIIISYHVLTKETVREGMVLLSSYLNPNGLISIQDELFFDGDCLEHIDKGVYRKK